MTLQGHNIACKLPKPLAHSSVISSQSGRLASAYASLEKTKDQVISVGNTLPLNYPCLLCFRPEKSQDRSVIATRRGLAATSKASEKHD